MAEFSSERYRHLKSFAVSHSISAYVWKWRSQKKTNYRIVCIGSYAVWKSFGLCKICRFCDEISDCLKISDKIWDCKIISDCGQKDSDLAQRCSLCAKTNRFLCPFCKTIWTQSAVLTPHAASSTDVRKKGTGRERGGWEREIGEGGSERKGHFDKELRISEVWLQWEHSLRMRIHTTFMFIYKFPYLFICVAVYVYDMCGRIWTVA